MRVFSWTSGAQAKGTEGLEPLEHLVIIMRPRETLTTSILEICCLFIWV